MFQHHQLRQKKFNEMEKKKRQERALRRREEDEEEYRHSVSQHIAISLEKAQQLRDEKDHQQVKVGVFLLQSIHFVFQQAIYFKKNYW